MFSIYHLYVGSLLCSCFLVQCGAANTINMFQNRKGHRSISTGHQTACERATRCPDNPQSCRLPHCRCTGNDIPGDLRPTETPQMIVLTFSGSLRENDQGIFDRMFQDRKNPNGCPAVGTFFVSGIWSDYYLVQKRYHERHEIASNGVEAKDHAWWQNATVDNFKLQMQNEKKLLAKWSNISSEDIRGWRTPFLYMGGDIQMEALTSSNMAYDSTRGALSDSSNPNLHWPFTQDYQDTETCPSGQCPECSWKGLWETAITGLVDSTGSPCLDLGSCKDDTTDKAYNTLSRAFNSRYHANRAPLLLLAGIEYLQDPALRDALFKFLDEVANQPDVWFVSVRQLLKFIQNPQPASHPPEAFSCSDPAPPLCNPFSERIPCSYDVNRRRISPGSNLPGHYSTYTCLKKCPDCYPALDDPEGLHC